MSEKLDKFMVTSVESQEQAVELIEQLFAVAQPSAVYSEPVTAGEYTVINAAEVRVGMGFGFGGGAGTGPRAPEEEEMQEGEARSAGTGYGSGGGGGGASLGRPVATITIGPGGVTVEPVVDVTKLGIAFFTTIGSMFMMYRRMRKAADR